MIANRNRTEQFCSRSNIDMASQDWHAARSKSDRYLLKKQAVGSNFCIWMDHDAVGMWQKKPAAELAIERNVCARNRRPEPMPCDGPACRKYTAFRAISLVVADACKQRLCRIPSFATLAIPGRLSGGDFSRRFAGWIWIWNDSHWTGPWRRTRTSHAERDPGSKFWLMALPLPLAAGDCNGPVGNDQGRDSSHLAVADVQSLAGVALLPGTGLVRVRYAASFFPSRIARASK